MTNFYVILIYRSRFPSSPKVSNLSLPEWQLKQDKAEEDETVQPNPDLIKTNNIEKEAPDNEID